MVGARNYIEKRLHDAEEAESKGKIETAIGIYEELGGEYSVDGACVALENGLLKKSIDIYLQEGMDRQAKLLTGNVKKRSRGLQKYLVRTLKYSNLSSDLQDPIISGKLLNIQDEFSPYFNEIQYRN